MPITATSPASPAHGHDTRYGNVAIALHWLLALALVGTFGMGLYMHELPLSPARIKLYNWHKWAGTTILALSLLRLAWRLGHRPPALPASVAAAMPAWQRDVYRGTHVALYLMCFAVPLAGWAYTSAAGFPVVWFGVLPLPDFVGVDKEFAETVLKLLHKTSAFVLAVLVLLHVAAALVHHFVRRDGLLARMWPARGVHGAGPVPRIDA